MKIIHLRVLILNSKIRSFPQHSLTFWVGSQQHVGLLWTASERCVVCVWMVLNLSFFWKGRALIFQTVVMKRARARASSDVCVIPMSLDWHQLREITGLSHAEWHHTSHHNDYLMLLKQKCFTRHKHERVLSEHENTRFGHPLKYIYIYRHAVDCILIVLASWNEVERSLSVQYEFMWAIWKDYY